MFTHIPITRVLHTHGDRSIPWYMGKYPHSMMIRPTMVIGFDPCPHLCGGHVYSWPNNLNTPAMGLFQTVFCRKLVTNPKDRLNIENYTLLDIPFRCCHEFSGFNSWESVYIKNFREDRQKSTNPFGATSVTVPIFSGYLHTPPNSPTVTWGANQRFGSPTRG